MEKGERSNSSGRNDWRVRLATAVGAGVGAAVALLVRPDLGGFWPGLIAFLVVLTVGGVVGRLVGVLLFRRSAGAPPDLPPAA